MKEETKQKSNNPEKHHLRIESRPDKLKVEKKQLVNRKERMKGLPTYETGGEPEKRHTIRHSQPCKLKIKKNLSKLKVRSKKIVNRRERKGSDCEPKKQDKRKEEKPNTALYNFPILHQKGTTKK